MGAERDGSEIAETVLVGVARQGRERAPGQVLGVEEERGRDVRILGEDAEEVREGAAAVVTAEGEESFGREEDVPGLAGGLEAAVVGVWEEGKDKGSNVVWKAGD